MSLMTPSCRFLTDPSVVNIVALTRLKAHLELKQNMSQREGSILEQITVFSLHSKSKQTNAALSYLIADSVTHMMVPAITALCLPRLASRRCV